MDLYAPSRGAVLGLGLIAACLAVPVLAAPPSSSNGGVVAYVEHVYPNGTELNQVAHLRRSGRAVRMTDDSTDLQSDDQLFIDRPGVVIVVRYLISNQYVSVRRGPRTGAGNQADLTIPRSSIPGLAGRLLALFKSFASNPDQRGDRTTITASRSAAAACYNLSGRTNEPTPFAIPILVSEKSYLAAGRRGLVISWQGGAPPYSVVLSSGESGVVAAQAPSVRNRCSVRLPTVELVPGRYQLTITDANNIKEEEHNLMVVRDSPDLPAEIRDADLPEEARALYFATWLAAVDHGAWAFEARQRVAAMDCRLPAVRDWLTRWGEAEPCAETAP